MELAILVHLEVLVVPVVLVLHILSGISMIINRELMRSIEKYS